MIRTLSFGMVCKNVGRQYSFAEKNKAKASTSGKFI
jgi:hypothetical protein